MMELK